MSKNHQFLELSDSVYARYKKTTNGAVSGRRLNPLRDNERVEFVLMSHHTRYNPDTNHLRFNYDTDILETYNEKDDRLFRLLNSYLFQNGYIAPYDGDRESVSTANALSDTAISDLAATKNLMSFKKKIAGLNRHNLTRLLDVVRRADRPISFATAIEEKLKEVQE